MNIGRNHPAHFPAKEVFNQPVILLVTVCTQNRKPILANQSASDLLRECWLKTDAWTVGRFVLMPDHLHLFCSPAHFPNHPLKQWVQFWKSIAS